MKGDILSIIVVALIAFSSYGQEKNISKGIGVGFNLTQNQNDFGLGLNVVSPYFAHGKIAFRLKGNLMWNEHLNLDNVTVWSPYSNLSFGIVGVAGEIRDFMRLYGEGGIITLFPSSTFSTEAFVLGGYGLFGFEFFFNNHNNYFIEIGGIGTGAVAEKVSRKPIYSNGLLINVGYRYQF